jgi:hypothetical protein
MSVIATAAITAALAGSGTVQSSSADGQAQPLSGADLAAEIRRVRELAINAPAPECGALYVRWGELEAARQAERDRRNQEGIRARR